MKNAIKRVQLSLEQLDAILRNNCGEKKKRVNNLFFWLEIEMKHPPGESSRFSHFFRSFFFYFYNLCYYFFNFQFYISIRERL